jgi:hypothetical protein
MVAATIIVVSLSIIIYGVVAKSHAPAAVPDMANPGAGGAQTGASPPDISQMTPTERFIRLNDRITTALESGDSATALRFLPMALTAYTMLDSVDVDARYHAATLQIAAGQPAAALALADSIQATAPDNLLGWIVRTSAALAKGDRAGVIRGRKGFLAAYETQIKLDRSEYREHRAVLEAFRQTAADSTR